VTTRRRPTRARRDEPVTRTRVVQSIHWQYADHQLVTSAAQQSGETVAAFVRAAALERVGRVFWHQPVDTGGG
jgi:uncharacterized protein (DUF1778 family)